MAPASTGKDSSRRIAVTRIDQASRGTLSIEIFLWCMLRIVAIKLIAPRMDDIPAMCKEKMVRSMEGPLL